MVWGNGGELLSGWKIGQRNGRTEWTLDLPDVAAGRRVFGPPASIPRCQQSPAFGQPDGGRVGSIFSSLRMLIFMEFTPCATCNRFRHSRPRYAAA